MKKEKIKNIVLIMVVAVISSTVTSFATSNYLFDSIDVKYDNSNGVQAETVQGAIDELYSCASDYSGIDTRVNTLEGYIYHGSSDNADWVRVGSDTTYTQYKGFAIQDNDVNRGALYYNPSTDTTYVSSYNSNGSNGQGTLNLVGNPVQVNGEDIMSPTYTGSSLSDKNIANDTVTSVGSVNLAAGIYILTFNVRFASNSSGYRMIGFSTTNSSFSNANSVNQTALNGGTTRMQIVSIYRATSSTTFYMNTYQNSGSTLALDNMYYRVIRLK